MALRSRSKSSSRGSGQGQRSRSSRSEARRESPRRPTARNEAKSTPPWLIPAIVVALVVLVGGILVFQRYRAAAEFKEEPSPTVAAPKAKAAPVPATAAAAAPSQKPATAALALELQPDGLHLAGTHITGANVLTAVANSLGAATRTNRAGTADTVIYAYDQQGLLIYSQPGGGTNSIILDCEANGGVNGTTSAFSGTLTIEGQAIRADTDPQALAVVKQLGLNQPGNREGIWSGRYHDLQLVFAYLKSARRLSLIEIDLK